jgi:hypothetical protein
LCEGHHHRATLITEFHSESTPLLARMVDAQLRITTASDQSRR